MKKTALYMLALCALATTVACGSRRATTATTPTPYQRQPIREVSEKQLDEDSQLIAALSLQQSGQTTEALDAYATLVGKRPGCSAAWFEMSRLLISRGWTDSAAACANRAAELDPTNRWYLMWLAEVQNKRGEKRAAAATWERIVKAEPNRLENYYELSDAYIDAGDLDAAVEALNRIERIVGITEDVSTQKQRIYTAAGKPDKAERELQRLADAMPHEKRYQAMMAAALMKNKRYSKAKQYYDRVLQADPTDEYIHIQLAEYYKATGNADQADRELAIAFENPKLDCGTKVQLLAQFYSNDEFYGSRSANTFALLEQAMHNCADSATYALVYADVLLRQDKYAEAVPWLYLALDSDSSQYQVWEATMVALGALPDRDAELQAVAIRAERLFPMKTLPLYIQAAHLMQQKQYAEALQKTDKIMRWGFENNHLEAETYALVAECCYRTGEYSRCWKAFDRCLQLLPNEPSILNNYAYYLAEQGLRLSDAERMSRRVIEAEPNNANSIDTYAWILHLLGRNAEALRYAQKAVQLNPQSDTLRSHLDQIKQSQ